MLKACALLGIITTLTVLGVNAISQGAFDPSVEKKCLDEQKLTPKDLLNYKSAINKPKVKREFKCFSYCLLKHGQQLDEEGKFKLGKTGPDMQKIEDCKAQHDLEDDECEYGFNIKKCVYGSR